jgi:hypothetical protein
MRRAAAAIDISANPLVMRDATGHPFDPSLIVVQAVAGSNFTAHSVATGVEPAVGADDQRRDRTVAGNPEVPE